MKLQRLKLYIVDDEKGTEVLEFTSYKAIKAYAKGKEGIVQGTRARDVRQSSVMKQSGEEVGQNGDENKTLIRSSLKKKVQIAKGEIENTIDDNAKADDTDKRPSFWDKLK